MTARLLLIMLVWGLWSPPVQAGEQHLRYEANWGGLHIADFTLSLLDGDGAYENRFHLESRGMTHYFTNLSVTAHSRGRIVDENGQRAFLAEHYRTEYTNTKHFRWVDIQFGQAGEPARATTGTMPIPGREDKWNPKDQGPEVLEKVEAEYRTQVNDPITLIAQMMDLVRAHLGGGPGSGIAQGFDGRRRFDMRVEYLGPTTRTVNDVPHETYRVRVTPEPVAGFKKRHKVLWTDAQYDFYLSRDGHFTPLQIVPLKHGPVLTLVAACARECELAEEE